MHHLHELLSSHPCGNGHPLVRCDVRIRLIVALAAIVAVVTSTGIGLGLLAFACCLAGMASARTPVRSLVSRLSGPLALAALVCLLQTFMTGSTPWGNVDLGPWRLTASREGFHCGVLVAFRVLGSLGIVMLLCQGTTAEELLAALVWARVPRTWIEIALLMHRYLHVLFAQAVCVVAAQKVRLGHQGLRRSLRNAGNLAGIVVVRSLDQAERTHEAMVARGYQGCLPVPALPPMSRRQIAVASIGTALVLAVYLLTERWPW